MGEKVDREVNRELVSFLGCSLESRNSILKAIYKQKRANLRAHYTIA